MKEKNKKLQHLTQHIIKCDKNFNCVASFIKNDHLIEEPGIKHEATARSC